MLNPAVFRKLKWNYKFINYIGHYYYGRINSFWLEYEIKAWKSILKIFANVCNMQQRIFWISKYSQIKQTIRKKNHEKKLKKLKMFWIHSIKKGFQEWLKKFQYLKIVCPKMLITILLLFTKECRLKNNPKNTACILFNSKNVFLFVET